MLMMDMKGGDESEDGNCGEKLLECNGSDEEGGDVFEIQSFCNVAHLQYCSFVVLNQC